MTSDHEWNLDCRSEEGVTVGLIMGLITVARVLVGRGLRSETVRAALNDLRTDEDVAKVMGPEL
jgi:hypothetical protein